jgi:hypothetical protein
LNRRFTYVTDFGLKQGERSIEMKNGFNLLVCVTLLAGVGNTRLAAADSMVQDSRYGSTSQEDTRFEQLGLFNGTHSELCGPVSVINVENKIRTVLGMDTHSVDTIEEVQTMVEQTAPTVGVPSQGLIAKGINLFNLATLMRRWFEDMGVGVNVTPKNGFELGDLTVSTQDHDAIIINIKRWAVQNLSQITQTNFQSGHFLVVSGYDPENQGQITVDDPAKPGYPRAMNLQPIHVPAFPYTVYQVSFPDAPNPTLTVLAVGIEQISF